MTRQMRSAIGLVVGLMPLGCGGEFASSASAGTDTSSSSTGPTTGSTSGAANTESDDSNSTGIEAGPECGNGVVEGDEECDDGNLAPDDGCSKVCADEYCGDGIVQVSEGCDLGSDNTDTSTCTSSCQKNVCGDGLQGPAEGCDDGNTEDHDGCGADCTLETCGNSELEEGETCDDGNENEDDGCTTLCAPPVCGDGVLSPSEGEDCDDGNPNNADKCPNDCTAPVCGDGIVEGLEECDEGDANSNGTSLCSGSCTLNVCGDGYLVPEFEACDDGETTGNGHSQCSPQCTMNICGDGYHHTLTEGCDAGMRNGYVPCSTGCEVVPEVVQLARSQSATCALYADGSLRCWGNPVDGVLGIEPPPPGYIGHEPGDMPPPVAELGGPIASISGSGGPSFCALRVDGAVVCWGNGTGYTYYDEDGHPYDYSGLLGPVAEEDLPDLPWTDHFVGDLPGELPPTPLPIGTTGALAVSTGRGSACAIGDDSTLRCWGRSGDAWPTLGYGATVLRAFTPDFPPPPVNLGFTPVSVNHGFDRTCVLGDDALVRCFGRSEGGRLGQAGTGPLGSGTSIDPPPVTDLGTPVAQITTDSVYGLCALGTDGSVRCFGPLVTAGYGNTESIGDDPGEMPPPPLEVGPDPIEEVVLAAHQACVRTDVGDIRCWGGNRRTWGYGNSELLGDEPGEMPPPAISLSRPALALFAASSGHDSFCAILDDHSVECWGSSVIGLETGLALVSIGDEPGEMPPPPLRLYE